MSESPSVLKGEPIVFLPDDLFAKDLETERKLPPFLHGKTSVFKLETIFSNIPLIQKYGQIKASSLDPLGAGAEGFVTRMHIGDRDIALKIMLDTQLPEADVSSFLSLFEISDSDRKYLTRRLCEESAYKPVDKQVFMQAGGFTLGHELYPDYFPESIGIVSFHGNPIGVVMPYVEGEKMQIEVALDIVDDPEIEKKIDHLNRAGVSLDYWGGAANAVIRKVNGSKKMTFLDAHLADERTLQRSNYQDLKEGEFFMKRVEEGIGPFDRVYVDVIPRSLEKQRHRINQYHEAQEEAPNEKFTFQDVLEGHAVISSAESKAHFENSMSRFEKWVTYLQSIGFPVDRKSMEFALLDDARQVFYNFSVPSEERDRHRQKKQPLVSFQLRQPDGVERDDLVEFQYRIEWYTSSWMSENKSTSVENNDNLIRFHIYQGGANDILEFDKHTSQFSYRRDVGNGRIVRPDSMRDKLIFRKFRNEFGISDLTSPKEIIERALKVIQEDKE